MRESNDAIHEEMDQMMRDLDLNNQEPVVTEVKEAKTAFHNNWVDPHKARKFRKSQAEFKMLSKAIEKKQQMIDILCSKSIERKRNQFRAVISQKGLITHQSIMDTMKSMEGGNRKSVSRLGSTDNFLTKNPRFASLNFSAVNDKENVRDLDFEDPNHPFTARKVVYKKGVQIDG